MRISPDAAVIAQWGPVVLNHTIVFTWVVIVLLAGMAWLASRRLVLGPGIPRWQHFLETIVGHMAEQIRDITNEDPRPFLPFLGTLFLFISVANLLGIVPGYESPTGSLSTASALAACVFLAVPFYGVTRRGALAYLKRDVRPVAFMLPFNIIGDLSRTMALAVRLFGNVMSGALVVGILVSIVPLVLPVAMQGLGLLMGQIQAYIFAVLAAVYIASGIRTERQTKQRA